MIFATDSYSHPPATIHPPYTVAFRYISKGGGAKETDAPEIQYLASNGIEVILNYEWYATRCTEGFAAGKADAEYANAKADSLGYSRAKPIYFSNDCSATFAQGVGAYFQAVAQYSVRPIDLLGAYGGQGVLLDLYNAGYVRKLWVANAASWSGFGSWDALRANLDPRVTAVQHLDHPYGFVGLIDHNEVLRADYGGGAATTGGLTVADVDTIGAWLKDLETRVSTRILDARTEIRDEVTAAKAEINATVQAAKAEIESHISTSGAATAPTVDEIVAGVAAFERRP